MNTNASITSTNKGKNSEMIVLAKYKIIQEREYDIKFAIRYDLMTKSVRELLRKADRKFSDFVRWIFKYLTLEVEIQAEKKQYTKILSITENGMEKLENMPENIVLLISTEDKNV